MSMVNLQALSAAALGAYVFGFLATNIHLGKFGIYEFDLFSSRYVIAGTLYLFFLAFWFCFAGQYLLLLERDEPGPEEGDSFVSNLLKWIRLVFLICVSTALFSIVFLECAEAVFFCVLAFLLRIIEPWWENLWESKGLSLRFPRCDLVAIPAVTVVAIVLFFLTIDVDSLAMILFFHFVVISIYARFAFRVAKRYQERGSEYESISKAMMHVGAFVLLSSTSFGLLQYGHVTSRLGGGQGQSVEVLVVDASVSKGLESMGFEVQPSLKAELIHRSERKVFIGVGNRIVALPRDAIGGVQVSDAGSSGWEVYAGKILAEVRATWE